MSRKSASSARVLPRTHSCIVSCSNILLASSAILAFSCNIWNRFLKTWGCQQESIPPPTQFVQTFVGLKEHLLEAPALIIKAWLHIFFSESNLAACHLSQLIVSVLHQNSEIHPQRPRDFLRPERSWVSGNLSAVGDGFPITSRVLVEYGHSLIINISTGSGSGNPSLWTEKDWQC